MNIKYPFEYGTDLKAYTKTKDQITTLNEVLTEMFDEDENLHQYINCIAVTNRDKCLNMTSYKKIMTDQLEENPLDNPIGNRYDNGCRTINGAKFDTIAFMNLGAYQLQQVCKSVHSSRRRGRESVDDNMYKIFKPNIGQTNCIASKMFNILPELKGIKGSFTNYNQLVKIMDGVLTDSYSYSIHNITEYVMVGTRNIVLAVILPNGNMLVKWSVINSLLMQDKVKAKEVLVALFARFDEFNKKIQSANVASFKPQVEEMAWFECYKHILNGLSDPMSFFPAQVSEHNTFRIDDIIQTQMDKILKDSFNGTVFAVKDEVMYYRLMKDCFKGFKAQVQKATKEAYKRGMAMSNKLAMLGWQVVDKTQVPDGGSDGCVWYRKEINLVPDRYEKSKKVYKIAEKQRQYTVKFLFVSSTSNVRAECENGHPNVHGVSKQVCTGDMERLDFSWTGDKIQDWLKRLESLLSLMNFDSPYYANILKVVEIDSELMDAYTTRDCEIEERKTDRGGGVRKLGSSLPEGTAQTVVEDEVEDDIAGLSDDNVVVADTHPDEEEDAPDYSDDIDISNGDSNYPAEVIQLRSQNGEVYNDQEFEQSSIADPTDEYHTLITEYRYNSANRKPVKDGQLPKPENRLRFYFPGSSRREMGVYRHAGGRVYYFRWDYYMTGTRLKQDEFEALVKFCILHPDQKNVDAYAEYLSEPLRKQFGLKLPVPKYTGAAVDTNPTGDIVEKDTQFIPQPDAPQALQEALASAATTEGQ